MHMTSAVARTTDQIIVLEPPPPHKLFDDVDTIRVYPPSTPAKSPNWNNAFDVMRDHTCVCLSCVYNVYQTFQHIIIIKLYCIHSEHGVIKVYY